MAEQKLNIHIPAPLHEFVDVDRDGHVSLSYPMMCGRLKATISHAFGKLNEAVALPKGKERDAALLKTLGYLRENLDASALLDRQWEDFRAARDAARKAVRHG